MLEILAAWRGLRRQRSGIILAIGTMALASCAAAIVFTVVNAVLVRPLPIRDAGHVAIVWEKRKSEAGKYGVSGADFYDWQRGASASVESMTAQDEHPMILAGPEPERVLAILTTTGFLETFGVNPLIGNQGDGRGAFLSYALWQRRFGGDRGVIGKTISLDGTAYAVAGVMPADFRMFFGRGAGDIYIPLEMPPNLRNSRDDHSFLVTARLRPGASFNQLTDELNAVNIRLQHDFPGTNTGHDALVLPLTAEVTETARPALMMLLGAVALLLLLACANVANLLLARSVSRANEMAVRRALGASMTDCAKLVLSESAMLAAAAGLAGLLAARLAVPLMAAIVPKTIGPVILPGMERLEVDTTVALFSALICGWMALLAALEPLRRLRHMESGIVRPPSTAKAQRGLAVAQIAIACALLTGAVALLLSFGRVINVSPGFAVARHQAISVSFGSGGSGERILEAVAALPGVKSAALASLAPGTVGGPRTGIRLATDPPTRTIEEAKKAFFRIVTPRFVSTTGIRLLRGREFLRSDFAASTRVMMVSQRLAQQYFPGQEILGRQMVTPIDNLPWTVIGVLDDIRQLGLDKDSYAEMYFPWAQWTYGKIETADLVIETAGLQPVSVASLRQAINGANPGAAVGKVQTIDQLVAESTAPRYFQTALMGGFSAVALLVALCGLYSVVAYLVEARRREMAVRMAVGATPARVIALVAREGATLAIIGCAIGIAAALAIRGFVGQFLFGVSADDPGVLVGVAVLLLAAAVAASVVPGARVSRLEIASTLRGD
jgi:predicted permease